MRLGDRTFDKPNSDFVIIPRGQEELIFTCEAVLDFTEFDAMVELPKPPVTRKRGDEKAKPNFQHPDHKKAIMEYANKRSDFIILKSLQATKDLIWDVVKMEDPDTWGQWSKELEDANFTDSEVTAIVECVTRVNNLNPKMLEEAKERFLDRQAQLEAEM